MIVLQVGDVLLVGIGMHKHLQALVLAQVERRILINALRLARGELVDIDIKGLLVVLYELGVVGILSASDTWWQHIVDRLLIAVLLDIDRSRRHRTCLCSAIVEVLLIDAPRATYEVEAAETQDDGMLEACEEHTHEADAREVVDAAKALLKLFERDAEKIPVDLGVVLAIAQCGLGLALVDDEVLANLQILRTDGHVVLEVFLVFVECVVLIDILHVGRTLNRGVVTLSTAVAVGRVALRVVDVLISAEDAGLHIVVV